MRPLGFPRYAALTDRRLARWLIGLAVLAGFNAAVWIWIACGVRSRAAGATTELVLSGIYVGVCGFRSLFPRVDLERLCLWDTWLSSVSLGRSAATLAELCFALQCGLFVSRLGQIAHAPVLALAPPGFLLLALVAEFFCWFAVLSLNHLGHAVEEALWALLMLMMALAFGMAAVTAHGTLRLLLLAGVSVYTVGAVATMVVDVRMYVHRSREWASGHLSLFAGLVDSHRRRHPTAAWAHWRQEAPWMTLYFSVGVWTSLAMLVAAR